jgi:hypothetical protein
MDLHLPPEIELSLRQHAAIAGMDVEQFAIKAIQSGIASSEMADDDVQPLPKSTWSAEFNAWLASIPKRKTHMDDSRESIYQDRGE